MARMTATLIVTSGPGAGRSFDVVGEIVIGRGDVDFVIEDQELSRRHAAVRPVEGGVEIEDLDSRNGSWLNGERIRGTVVLTQPGVLRLGGSEIRVELPPSDETVVRGVPSELAPLTTLPPTQIGALPHVPQVTQVSPAVAPPAPPAPPAPAAASDEAAERRPPPTSLRGKLPLLAGAVVVVVVVALVVVAQTGGSSKTRRLSATLTLGLVSRDRDRALLAGVQGGPPAGTGAVTVDEVFQPGGSTGNTVAIPVSGKLISRFDKGSVTSVLQLVATRQPDRSVRFVGQGTVVEGTGEFDGASGSFRYEASQPPGSTKLTATLTGTLKY
jgi:hypothetical protein